MAREYIKKDFYSAMITELPRARVNDESFDLGQYYVPVLEENDGICYETKRISFEEIFGREVIPVDPEPEIIYIVDDEEEIEIVSEFGTRPGEVNPPYEFIIADGIGLYPAVFIESDKITASSGEIVTITFYSTSLIKEFYVKGLVTGSAEFNVAWYNKNNINTENYGTYSYEMTGNNVKFMIRGIDNNGVVFYKEVNILAS